MCCRETLPATPPEENLEEHEDIEGDYFGHKNVSIKENYMYRDNFKYTNINFKKTPPVEDVLLRIKKKPPSFIIHQINSI